MLENRIFLIKLTIVVLLVALASPAFAELKSSYTAAGNNCGLVVHTNNFGGPLRDTNHQFPAGTGNFYSAGNWNWGVHVATDRNGDGVVNDTLCILSRGGNVTGGVNSLEALELITALATSGENMGEACSRLENNRLYVSTDADDMADWPPEFREGRSASGAPILYGAETIASRFGDCFVEIGIGQSLEYLLQAPKLRGNYGETILEEMLERILPNKAMWERQYAIEGGEKVDAVIKYKDVIVPIDSKFPKEDYQKYLAASDPREKKEHWANYERALKTQINSIKEKYVKPEKGTTEFALLFIPSESIYYETIAEKNYLGDPCQINEYATDRKVIPVSPNTFYAFLQVVILGIRNIEIAKEARKLQESLAKVERDFGLFYKKFEIIGKSLDSASKAYETGDGHVQRFKRSLDSTLKLDERFQGEVESGALTEQNTDDYAKKSDVVGEA